MNITVLYYSKEGIPVILNQDTEEICYKDNNVSVNQLIEAFNSGLDRVVLTPKLNFVRLKGFIEFGCLTMSEEKFKLLKTKVCQILQKKQKEELQK